NHTSRGSISTSTLPSIKLRKCSSKIITSILSFISGRLATKSNQIKQLIRNGRSASLQRTLDRKSGSAGMPRPISYAVFCLKKKKKKQQLGQALPQSRLTLDLAETVRQSASDIQ